MRNQGSVGGPIGDSKSCEYRPDIDGLRAIAIALVVGFHVGLPWFEGGFIGVDIFFVISGFLITNLLLKDLHQHDTIALLAFFARRARRLFPAFFVVAMSTLVLGFFFLSPIDEQSELAHSAIAAAFYSSNMHFAVTGGDYFDDFSALNPLLHTWSLAVEGQYYLIWPLVLMAAAWMSRWLHSDRFKILLFIVILVSLTSFAFSWYATESGGRAARIAFFALPSRAWELGLGAILAITLPHYYECSNNKIAALLACVGFFSIVAVLIMFHEGIQLMNVGLILSTFGTACIIAGGNLGPRTSMTRLLTSEPLVSVGLLSYSWYLWHWPLLAIVRSHTLGAVDIARDLSIAIAALGLAWVTYNFVEYPLRSHRIAVRRSHAGTLGAAATGSLLIALAAFVSTASAERPSFNIVHLNQAKNDKGWSRLRCHHDEDIEFRELIPRSRCLGFRPSTKKILLLWGDSHADALVGVLEAAVGNQFIVLPRSMSGCPPLLGIVPVKLHEPYEKCGRFNKQVVAEIQYLHRNGDLVSVVMAAHWTAYLDKPTLSGETGRSLRRDRQATRDDRSLHLLQDGLSATLNRLSSLGVKSLVIAPVAEQKFHATKCLSKRSPRFCSVPRLLAERHREPATRAVQTAVHASVLASLWDPFPSLCGPEVCSVEKDGIVIYRDEDHLTYTGAKSLGTFLAQAPAWRELVAQKGCERAIQTP